MTHTSPNAAAPSSATSGFEANHWLTVTKLRNDGVIIRLYHREDAKTIRLISMNRELYPDTLLKASEYRWCWPVEELVRKKF